MQSSPNQQNTYTCLYARQSPERDPSAQNNKASLVHPQSSSVLSDALCLELSGKTCDEAEKAKIDRLREKRYCSTENVMRQAQMKKVKDCCTSHMGPQQCCNMESGERCKDEMSRTASQNFLQTRFDPNIGNNRNQNQTMERWDWVGLKPHETKSFIDLRDLDDPNSETEANITCCSHPKDLIQNKRRNECICPRCKPVIQCPEPKSYQDYENSCQCSSCIQERCPKLRPKPVTQQQECCCSCCMNKLYENPFCVNNNLPLSNRETQTTDLDYYNFKDYQCTCQDCVMKRQKTCECCSVGNSDCESYGPNYIDLPYQTTDDYMDLIEELEEKLVTRNKNRVRKTMMEFENKSRQNKPLDKPILDHDEISEGDEPILENLSELKRRKIKPCLIQKQCYAQEGDTNKGLAKPLMIKNPYGDYMPHSPLRFKWKMNRFGEWKKIAPNENTCECNCNCRRMIPCRKLENFN